MGVRHVVVIDGELLKLGSYVVEVLQRHPGIEIPFVAYLAKVNSLADVVSANLDERPVYVARPMPEPPPVTSATLSLISIFPSLPESLSNPMACAR